MRRDCDVIHIGAEGDAVQLHLASLIDCRKGRSPAIARGEFAEFFDMLQGKRTVLVPGERQRHRLVGGIGRLLHAVGALNRQGHLGIFALAAEIAHRIVGEHLQTRCKIILIL